MQAIYDLVGDRIRDIFDQQAVLIGSFDHAQDLEIFNYEWESGRRHHSPPRKINRSRRNLIESRKPDFNNRITPEGMAERGRVVGRQHQAGPHPVRARRSAGAARA